jgi:hypothetical protein
VQACKSTIRFLFRDAAVAESTVVHAAPRPDQKRTEEEHEIQEKN